MGSGEGREGRRRSALKLGDEDEVIRWGVRDIIQWGGWGSDHICELVQLVLQQRIRHVRRHHLASVEVGVVRRSHNLIHPHTKGLKLTRSSGGVANKRRPVAVGGAGVVGWSGASPK